MQLTKDNIGEIWYPVDNSYLLCKTTKGKDCRLAGVMGVEALPCKIVSPPYSDNLVKRQPAFDKNRGGIHEFIDVEYAGEIYSILNIFHESYAYMVQMKNYNVQMYYWAF